MRRLAVVIVAVCALVGAGGAGAIAYRTFQLGQGDVAVVKGTNLGCGVGLAGGEKLLTCSKVDAKGALPGSYAVSISATGVYVTKFDAKRHPKVVFQKKHGQ